MYFSKVKYTTRMEAKMAFTQAYENEWLQEVLNQHVWRTLPAPEDLMFERNLYDAVQQIVGASVNLPENVQAKKQGGCLAWARKTSEPYISAKFFGSAGSEDPEFGLKNDKYIVYALSKLAVLIQNPGFTTSYENKKLRKEDQLLIGETPVPEGAIALPNDIILSFSGFAGYIDEAICLAVALKCHLINDVQARDIEEAGTGKSYDTAIQLLKMATSGKF